MAEFPRLPLHVGDYRRGTPPVNAATWLHHGIYFIALMLAWDTAGTKLPANDKWLMLHFGCDAKALQKDVQPVLQTYFKRRGGYWCHPRLAREKTFILQTHEKRRAAAKSRWDKEREASKSNAPTPTPTPTLNSSVEKEINPDSPVGARRAKARPHTGPKGSRWAADATVPDDWHDLATLARLKHKLPAIDTKLEADKFTTHWSSATGTRATKVDWCKTWINWILKAEVPRGRNGPDHQPRRPNARENFAIAAKRVLENIERQNGPAEGNPADADAPVSKLLPP